jgi:hypothetical protein
MLYNAGFYRLGPVNTLSCWNFLKVARLCYSLLYFSSATNLGLNNTNLVTEAHLRRAEIVNSVLELAIVGLDFAVDQDERVLCRRVK